MAQPRCMSALRQIFCLPKGTHSLLSSMCSVSETWTVEYRIVLEGVACDIMAMMEPLGKL